MAEETNHNQAGEVPPSVAEENAPSTDSPETTAIPTANAPDPTAVNPENSPNAAKPSGGAKKEKPTAKEQTAEGDKPASAKGAKKDKPPAVEDKPFVEFIQQDYLPALQKAIAQEGVQNLQLSFAKQKVSVTGYDKEEFWQVMGSWQNGLRQFNLYFPEENIQGQKVFSCNEGKKPSTLESFLIDERKITLDLMVFGLVQRLNGQKWLGRN
jgi:Protein of unknown function (DUF2996)